MTNCIEQKCPLCQKNAKFELLNFYTWKHFKCVKCTEFVISNDVERVLPDHIPQLRTAFSDKAKQSDGERILVITRASAVDIQEWTAHQLFNADFIERKKFVR